MGADRRVAGPRRLRAWCLTVVLAAGLGGAGCSLWRPPAEPLAAAPLELTATPFFPQRDYLCGPAALATVLGASGVAVHPDELIDALYVPDRHGTLQVELSAAARRHGRLAVPLEGRLSELIGQLQAGRPVLVLQNLASSLLPVWHYAVVIGYLPERDAFVLRSGRRARLYSGRNRFAATWQRADRWGLVLLAPGAPPRGLPRASFLQAAAALETMGEHGAALASFDAAVRAWPDDPTAALGVANNLYHLGRLDQAAAAYRRVLDLQPGDPVALHNLVSTELARGDWCAAREVLAGSSTPAAEPPGDAAAGLIAAAARAVRDAAADAPGCAAALTP